MAFRFMFLQETAVQALPEILGVLAFSALPFVSVQVCLKTLLFCCVTSTCSEMQPFRHSPSPRFTAAAEEADCSPGSCRQQLWQVAEGESSLICQQSCSQAIDALESTRLILNLVEEEHVIGN